MCALATCAKPQELFQCPTALDFLQDQFFKALELEADIGVVAEATYFSLGA
jgi:hypothetical protein